MLERLYEIHKNVTGAASPAFQRYLMGKIDWGQRLIGVIGARGVGKTTLLAQHYLLHYQSPEECLYVSADNVVLQGSGGLLAVATEFFRYGGQTLLIDEVHKYPGWSQELKNIHDSFPERRIVFSGSSMLDLIKGKHDLSRRAVIYRMAGLSFREYLEVTGQVKCAPCTLEKVLASHVEIADRLARETAVLKHFKQYLRAGYYPYFIESPVTDTYYNKLGNALEKILYEDIPSVFGVKPSSIPSLKKLIYLVATSQPFQVSIENLSRDLKISREYVYLFIDYLAKAGVFNVVHAASRGKALLRKPEKILLENPNLFFMINQGSGFDYEIGAIRESFFLNQVGNVAAVTAGGRADFLVNGKLVFEVGGKSKGKRQIEASGGGIVVKDGIEIGSRGVIPLWVLGLLY